MRLVGFIVDFSVVVVIVIVLVLVLVLVVVVVVIVPVYIAKVEFKWSWCCDNCNYYWGGGWFVSNIDADSARAWAKLE